MGYSDAYSGRVGGDLFRGRAPSEPGRNTAGGSTTPGASGLWRVSDDSFKLKGSTRTSFCKSDIHLAPANLQASESELLGTVLNEAVSSGHFQTGLEAEKLAASDPRRRQSFATPGRFSHAVSNLHSQLFGSRSGHM